MNINILDAGFAAVLILFALRGLVRGLVREIAGLLGILLGFILAKRYYHLYTPHVEKFISDADIAYFISYAAMFFTILILVSIFARFVEKTLDFTFTSWISSILGAVFGFMKGAVLCTIAFFALTYFVPDSPFLMNSWVAKHKKEIVSFAEPLIPQLEKIKGKLYDL